MEGLGNGEKFGVNQTYKIVNHPWKTMTFYIVFNLKVNRLILSLFCWSLFIFLSFDKFLFLFFLHLFVSLLKSGF